MQPTSPRANERFSTLTREEAVEALVRARNVIEYFESLRLAPAVDGAAEWRARPSAGEPQRPDPSHVDLARAIHAEIMRQYMCDPLGFREPPPSEVTDRFAGVDLMALARGVEAYFRSAHNG